MSTERMTTDQFNALPAKAKGKETPETALKRACVQYLELQGWYSKAWFQQGMMPKSLRGMPDRIAIKNGRHVWLEFKVGSAKLRPDQELRKAELEAAGATVLVVRRLEDLYVLGDERQMILGSPRR